MHSLRQKEIIVNSLTSYPINLLQASGIAATTAGNTATIKIDGFGTISKADISSVSLARPVAGVAAIKTMTAGVDLTIGTITEPGSLIFKFKIESSKHEAMYHRFRQLYGREPISYQVRVLTTDTDDQIVSNLYDAMVQRQNNYPDDLPFTVSFAAGPPSVITFTGKAGYEHVSFELDEISLKTIDDGTELSYVTLAQLTTGTPAVVPLLDGNWVEQNIAMNTHAILSPYAEKKDDITVTSESYSNITINWNFLSDLMAAPAQVGQDVHTGNGYFSMYIRDALIQATPNDDTTDIGLLLSVLYTQTIDGAYGTNGAVAATKGAFLA